MRLDERDAAVRARVGARGDRGLEDALHGRGRRVRAELFDARGHVGEVGARALEARGGGGGGEDRDEAAHLRRQEGDAHGERGDEAELQTASVPTTTAPGG